MSCMKNLANLNIKIKESFSEKKELLAAFLDVKGAFDGVIVDILLQTLASLGVPQGGDLSPLLYVLYVAKIMTDLPKTINISQFGDDIALFCKFLSRKRATRILTNSIKKIDKNLRELGLKLAPNTTQLVHFNKKNIRPGEIQIELNA
ncbi:hypothetical protein TSAR_001811 [Trichomalopsis sarcophagae]|uniref:Reverse transcriptase domain-containing protein n=1 Tax=Trichomalopsis sarcophagae TaxID=543379 RepID=A0A232EJU5_9HYME|nr:hypothetical protein TSAR_001811 [Trichomalopsis sarcophagae]